MNDPALVRVADRLVLDRPQAEPLCGIISGLLETAVVEDQELGLSIFEEKLPVIGTFKSTSEQLSNARPVEAGTINQRRGWGCHVTISA